MLSKYSIVSFPQNKDCLLLLWRNLVSEILCLLLYKSSYYLDIKLFHSKLDMRLGDTGKIFLRNDRTHSNLAQK